MRSATPSASSTRCSIPTAADSRQPEIGRALPQPRPEFFAGARPSQPHRSRQAADAHHHSWHGRRERAGLDAVRRHGRTVPGNGSRASAVKAVQPWARPAKRDRPAATVSAAGNEDGRNGGARLRSAAARRSRRAALSCAHPLGQLAARRRSLSIGSAERCLAAPTPARTGGRSATRRAMRRRGWRG